jgi:uncharacterized protein YndB with AHSA1/START domain
MARCAYEVTARSDAPPERVFALLADATSWPRWAGPLIARGSWEREGEPPPGGVGAIRRVGRAPLLPREEIVVHDPPHHHGYTILSGQPVRNYRADVLLEPDTTAGGGGSPGTRITWRATFDPVVPGTGPLVSAVFRRIIGGFARRLAAYASRG